MSRTYTDGANDVNFFITAPMYGAFLASDGYGKLIEGVINGVPNYNGNMFSSELGIHTDITDGTDNVAIDKLAADDCKMVLMPLSVSELAGSSADGSRNPLRKHSPAREYRWDGTTYMESLPLLGPKEPRTDYGLLDFKADSMIMNDPGSFTNIPINPDYFYDEEIEVSNKEMDQHMLLKLKTPQLPTTIEVNSYGHKYVSLR
ncbi:MAG: hypothetical protein ACK5MR_05110 [Cumulibacter sp.]